MVVHCLVYAVRNAYFFVIIDENLLWHEHVDFLCKKVIASLSMLKRIRNFLDERELLLLYTCLIQSQLDYCCEVWGSR